MNNDRKNSPLDNTAKLTPISEDSMCDANKNTQRPQLELASQLHDGECAAIEKCDLDCLERAPGRTADEAND